MFSKTASEHITNRRLSQCDRYLLLWVIHLLTRGASSDRRQGRPLRQYSHTVIDEAQYYHPLVLRLLVDFAMPPLRSVTIVGDLEQKVSNDGGLVGWEDAGITVEAGKIFRLNTNYRWSQAVFSFLDKYRRLAGLRELKEPRRWASGAGLKPVVVRCGDEDREASWLVDRIAEVRRKDWSIAVVVPPGLGEDWRQRVIGELASCDIRSRWATGEDVRECQEQIILTNYESIVGLEFDAVFLPGCDRVLIPPAPGADSVQAAWVALTRSRQFVAVSHIGPVAIFSNGEFDHYRSEAT